MIQKHSPQSGQIALAVLLIMMVVLVVSLAVASRTTKNIVQTTQTAEAAQVFAAAETTAEQTLNSVITNLQTNLPITSEIGLPETIPNSNVQVRSDISAQTTLNVELAQGETAQVQFDPSASPQVPTVKITWAGGVPNSEKASLVIAQYYTEAGVTKVEYSLIKACNSSDMGDGFEVANGCSGAYNDGDPSIHTISVKPTPLALRVQAVYFGTVLSVEGVDGTLPAQQYLIRTEAVNTSADIQENAALQVTATNLLPPPFLDYVLYSGGSIQK